jgi:hypothetical protein
VEEEKEKGKDTWAGETLNILLTKTPLFSTISS